jgi:hypothetical protein
LLEQDCTGLAANKTLDVQAKLLRVTSAAYKLASFAWAIMDTVYDPMHADA